MATPLKSGLTQAESDFLSHMIRWGSDGYPIQKVSRGWLWNETYGIKGAPVVYKTKREVSAAIERYIEILLERHGEARQAEELAAA